MNIDDENDDTHAARCLRAVDRIWAENTRERRESLVRYAMSIDAGFIKQQWKGNELTGSIFARRQSLAAGHFWRNQEQEQWRGLV